MLVIEIYPSESMKHVQPLIQIQYRQKVVLSTIALGLWGLDQTGHIF